MKKMLSMLALLALLTLPAPVLAAEYSRVIEDLPLMPTLTERPEKTAVFDNPEGRVIFIEAETPANDAQVKTYYYQNLPSLGWVPAEGTPGVFTPNVYTRDGEQLTIETLDDPSGPTTVYFSIAPAPGAETEKKR